MISYVIDGVLLLALLLTSFRVGTMHRELKRLRGYQRDYVEILGKTSAAANHIGDALRHLAGDGREMLQRLEAQIGEGRVMERRLHALMHASVEVSSDRAADDLGTYTRKSGASAPAEPEAQRIRNEILKFSGDNRRPQDRRDEPAASPPSLLPKPGRELRLGSIVKTVRTASGNS